MLQLSKGGNLLLSKVTTDTKLRIGLGWDKNSDSTIREEVDIDVFGIIVDETNKGADESLVRFYNNVDGSGISSDTAYGACKTKEEVFAKAKELLQTSVIVITKDNRTGEGDGDDENLFINTALCIPGKKVIIAINIYEAASRKQLFGMIKNAYCSVYDEKNAKLFNYDLGEDFSLETGVIVGEFYMVGTEVKFRALGTGFEGDVNKLITQYK
jgi:tellurium resistance protein TerD